MVLSIIFGILILAIIFFMIIRIVKNILVGLALIFFVIALSYLLLGSLPNLRDIPIIGKKIPSTIGELIELIEKFFYNLKVLEVSRDSQNRILIVAQNTGKFSVSDFSVYVDGKRVSILNELPDSLVSGRIVLIQTDWKENFSEIIIQTNKAKATYSKR